MRAGVFAGLRLDTVHKEVRARFIQEQTSQAVCALVGNNQQRVEQWVGKMLAEKSGPKKVLDVLYTKGRAMEFFKLIVFIEGDNDNSRKYRRPFVSRLSRTRAHFLWQPSQ